MGKMLTKRQYATRQPQGAGWRTDWSSGLLHLWDGSRFYDRGSVDFAAAISDPATTIGRQGRELLTTDVDGYSVPTVLTNAWTIATIIRPINYVSGTDNRLVSVQESPNSGTADRGLRFTAGFAFEAQIFDGASKTVVGPTLAGNVYYKIVITCDGSNLTLFVNGVKYGPTAVANAGFSGYSSPEFGVGACGSTGTARESAIPFAAFYSRAWTDGKAVAWSRNQWGIFYRDEPILIPQAAAPTGFQAAWAKGSNVILGAWH